MWPSTTLPTRASAGRLVLFMACALHISGENECAQDTPQTCTEHSCETSLTSAYYAAMIEAAAASKPVPACPPDRYTLGKYSWTLLHSIAAYYPEYPTAGHQLAAEQFLRAFPILYPCRECAHDLEDALQASPPRLGSRAEFSIWMCELHNHVNARIGKLPIKCDLHSLDEAWRTPSKECAQAQAELAAQVRSPA